MLMLFQVREWIVSPYKAPARYEADNNVFNKKVSKLRIRSEHTIGFLKGRFHSLKNLRVIIRDGRTHRIATMWVAACIAIHNFAMECEAEEAGGADPAGDPFVDEGLRDEDVSDGEGGGAAPGAWHTRSTELRKGREKREQLKRRLFRHNERRERWHRA